MVHLPLSLPASQVLPLCSSGHFLGPAFPVVAPRCLACLVLMTRSAMTRFPFLVCMSLPPISLLPVLLLPRLLTAMMMFPFRVLTLSSSGFVIVVYAEVPLLRQNVSHLCSSTSPPIVRPQPARQVGGRGRCRLRHDSYRFASFFGVASVAGRMGLSGPHATAPYCHAA
jgi:hypothetical protein